MLTITHEEAAEAVDVVLTVARLTGDCSLAWDRIDGVREVAIGMLTGRRKMRGPVYLPYDGHTPDVYQDCYALASRSIDYIAKRRVLSEVTEP